VQWLEKKKIKTRRVLAGTYMTSLNMPGFSLTLLLLPRSGDKYSSEQIVELIDAPASAPGWAWTSRQEPGKVGAKEQAAAETRSKEVDLARKPIRCGLD
jgi:dihydroxyacetone kinase